MKGTNTYLTFSGNCREAMTFYKKSLDANLEIMSFADAEGMDESGQCKFAPELKENVMHACLTKGPVMIMASDTIPEMPVTHGNNFSINLNCESKDEIEKLFNALGDGGKVIMPLADAFWGAHFGLLTDKFGINWMFNYELPKKA